MAQPNDFLNIIKNVPGLGGIAGGIGGAIETAQTKPNFSFLDLLGGYTKGSLEGTFAPVTDAYDLISRPVITPPKPTLSEMQQAAVPTFQSIQTSQNVRDSFPQTSEESLPEIPPTTTPSIDDRMNELFGVISGPSPQDLALQSAKEYDRLIKQSNSTYQQGVNALLQQNASKIKRGLTPAEKKALDTQLKALERKYRNSLEDAQKAYNFASRNIQGIKETTSRLNEALLPAVRQYAQETAGGMSRIAAESGLAGVGGGVAPAPVSDAARAAAVAAQGSLASLAGTEAAGLETSPAIAALMAGLPEIRTAGFVADPRQFGAIQAGRFGSDVAAAALEAAQAGDISGIARDAASVEASIRENALLRAAEREERQQAAFDQMAFNAQLGALGSAADNERAAIQMFANALGQSNLTPQEIARQQLALQELGILTEQKYAPGAEQAEPTIGEAYQAGLANPATSSITNKILSAQNDVGDIVVSTPGKDKEPVVVPGDQVVNILIPTIGTASSLAPDARLTYITTQLIEGNKANPLFTRALSIALTGKAGTNPGQLANIINSSLK